MRNALMAYKTRHLSYCDYHISDSMADLPDIFYARSNSGAPEAVLYDLSQTILVNNSDKLIRYNHIYFHTVNLKLEYQSRIGYYLIVIDVDQSFVNDQYYFGKIPDNYRAEITARTVRIYASADDLIILKLLS